MNKSFSISFVLIFYCSILFAQNNINSYKYILVPRQFEFQKSQDQYQLNSLTKFLFNKAGFSVLYTDEHYPEDLANKNCLALTTKINSGSSLFKTKMSIELYDCQNKVVYITKEGISREKDYKKSYQEAIRNAFIELEELNYAYDNTSINNNKNEIEDIKFVEDLAEVQTIENSIVEQVEEVISNPTIKEVEPMVEAKEVVEAEVVVKSAIRTIEGKFNFENWGVSTISKSGNEFIVVGGDENFEFANIYKTSKPTIFIIKWVAYKKPQLLEIDSNGDLNVDTETSVKIYKRVD